MKRFLLITLLILNFCILNCSDDKKTPTSPTPVDPGKIAFMDVVTQYQHDIYMLSLSDGLKYNLTASALHEYSPAWSPDGTQMVYTKDPKDTVFIGNLYISNADGSNPVAITSGIQIDRHTDWSEDGSKLIFSRSGHLCSIQKDFGLNLDTLIGPPTLRYGAYSPTWSPDGTKFAFSSSRFPDRTTRAIFVADADGGNAHVVCDTPSCSNPDWASTGTKIIFEKEYGGFQSIDSSHICMVNSDGSGYQELTTGPYLDRTPDWSPNNTEFVFVSNRDPSDSSFYQMYTGNINNGTVVDLKQLGQFPNWGK